MRRSFLLMFFLLFVCVRSVSASFHDEVGTNINDDKGRVFLTGRVLSYAWLLGDGRPISRGYREDFLNRYGYYDPDYKNSGSWVNPLLLGEKDKDLNTWGTNYDAVLALGLRSGRTSSGIVYGADFALDVPVGSVSKSFYGKTLSKGSRVFLTTHYGDLSLGYQEGVESSMKVDVFRVVSGEEASIWNKYLRFFFGDALVIPLHTYPGLYSENLFRSLGNIDGGSTLPAGSKNFAGVLPLRFSYVSPEISGFSFGASYSPSGYRSDLFKDTPVFFRTALSYVGLEEEIGNGSNNGSAARNWNILVRSVRGGRVMFVGEATYDSGPVYKNLLSGAVRYDWRFSGAKLGVSVVGEYGRPARRVSLPARPYRHFRYLYDDLASFAVGFQVEANNGIGGALSYGYLGNSGRPKVVEGYEVAQQSPVLRESVPSLSTLPSYYLASSLYYKYGPFRSSIAYFVSRMNYSGSHAYARRAYGVGAGDSLRYYNAGGEGVLRDLAFGLDYVLYYTRGTKLGLFANCHVFTVEREFLSYLPEYENLRMRGEGSVSRFRSVDSHNVDYSGLVFLSGIRFEF